MCIWESKRSQISSQASQHTLSHLRHQRGTGSCFKTFSCSSAAFHSPYKPPACRRPPCLWPRRGSGVPLIPFPLKAISSHGQEDVQRQTGVRWPASELMEHKVNMIVAHEAPGTLWEILCVFFSPSLSLSLFIWVFFMSGGCTLAIPGRAWKMHAGGMVVNVNREIKQSGWCWRGSWCDKSCRCWRRSRGEEEEGGVRHGGQGAAYSTTCPREWLKDTLYSRVWFRVWLLMQSHLWHSDLCRAPLSLPELFLWFKPRVAASLPWEMMTDTPMGSRLAQ